MQNSSQCHGFPRRIGSVDAAQDRLQANVRGGISVQWYRVGIPVDVAISRETTQTGRVMTGILADNSYRDSPIKQDTVVSRV